VQIVGLITPISCSIARYNDENKMVLMFTWDVYGDRIGQKCNSEDGGKWL